MLNLTEAGMSFSDRERAVIGDLRSRRLIPLLETIDTPRRGQKIEFQPNTTVCIAFTDYQVQRFGSKIHLALVQAPQSVKFYLEPEAELQGAELYPPQLGYYNKKGALTDVTLPNQGRSPLYFVKSPLIFVQKERPQIEDFFDTKASMIDQSFRRVSRFLARRK